eukprot:scaffold293788_cov17-Tisochrysis_lutea.AAC.2
MAPAPRAALSRSQALVRIRPRIRLFGGACSALPEARVTRVDQRHRAPTHLTPAGTPMFAASTTAQVRAMRPGRVVDEIALEPVVGRCAHADKYQLATRIKSSVLRCFVPNEGLPLTVAQPASPMTPGVVGGMAAMLGAGLLIGKMGGG